MRPVLHLPALIRSETAGLLSNLCRSWRVLWTLTLIESWETGLTCPVLGGVRQLPGGDLLVTCDSAATVMEFRSGDPDPIWRGKITCDTFSLSQLSRAVPVEVGWTRPTR